MPFTLEIIQDHDPQNPRDWDNVAKFVFFHNRYDLPHEIDQKVGASWDALEAILKAAYGAVAVKPVYMYDHSGLTIKTSPFSCRWDSGQIGFAFVDRETIIAEHPGRKRVSRGLLAWADARIESEIETYDMFLRGDVWGYIIKEGDEEVEACWGFFGEEYCRQEGEAVLASLVAKEWKQADLFKEVM